MSKRSFTRASLTLAAVLCAGAASAAPVLKSEIAVNSALVTIGDLFDDAGLLAETAIFRAPAPGTAGTVSLEDIERAVQAAGLETFDAPGIDAVRVARIGAPVDMTHISDLIAADLGQRGILGDGMDLQLSLDAPLPDLVAADPENPVRLSILRYMPGSSSFSARIEIAGIDAPLDLSGQIQLMIEAPHLAQTLPSGAIISPGDIEMRMVPLAQAEIAGLARIEDVVGKQLRRQVRGGVLLRPNDLTPPELISRNETVTVIYRQGSLTLTTRGKALNAASLNDPVSVLNPMTRKVLHGVATENGDVAIGAGPQQMAGL